LTDPRKLKQILINLVGNALKFTFKGHIKVLVELINRRKALIRISVQDTGIGIKTENLGKLFKIFSMIADS